MGGHEIDHRTSFMWFDGWLEPLEVTGVPAWFRHRAVAKARSWLVNVGWRMHGLISLLECPRAAVP